MQALADWDSGIPIVSEESEIPDYESRKGWVRFWLVDPLDGTKEFLQRNGEFTVNIALIDHGEPVLGVVHAPALAVTYAGGLGLGSWRYVRGRRCRAAGVGPFTSPRLSCGSSRAARTRRPSSNGICGRCRLPNACRSGAPSSSATWPRAGPTSIRE